MMIVLYWILGIAVTVMAWWSSYILATHIYNKQKVGVVDYLHAGFMFLVLHICTVIFICGALLHNLHPIMTSALSLGISCSIFMRHRKSQANAALLSQLKTSARNYLKSFAQSKMLLACLSIFLLFQALVLTRIVVAPPNVFDAQVYHLPISINWFQNNEIRLFEDVPVGRFNYATKAPKMLNFWMLMFTRGNIELIELTQYFGFILLMLSVYGIVKSFRTSRFWATSAVFFTTFIPILMIETHTLQDHMLLFALHFTFIKFIFDYIDEKFVSKGVAILALSVSCGLLLAGKFSAPAHVASIIAVSSIVFFSKIRELFSKKLVGYIVVGTVMTMCIGGIWYLFNYINYNSVFGPKHAQTYKENILLTNILEVPYKLSEIGHRYTPDLINISGFGPFVVTVGLVLALWASAAAFFKVLHGLIGRHTESVHVLMPQLKVLMLVGSSLLLLLFYFSVYLTPYNYRLLSFVAVTIIIIATIYISTQKNWLLRGIFLGFGMLSMGFTLVTTLDTDYFPKPVAAWKNYLHSYPDDRTIVRLDHTSDKFKKDNSFVFINQFIPLNEPILYITQHTEGYDDLIIAAYYDNNLIRRMIWGGSLVRDVDLNAELEIDLSQVGGEAHSSSRFFNADGTSTPELVPYMRQNHISYLHNNIVFYYENPAQLVPGDDFIEITENVWYLPPGSHPK